MTAKLYRLPNRQVLRLRGDKARSFVHDVSTQDLADLSPGAGSLTAFLTDKGKLRGIARAFVIAPDEVFLDGEDEQRLDDVVVPWAPLSGIEVEVEDWVGLRVVGTPGDLRAIGVDPPDGQYGTTWFHDVLCVRGGWGEDGWDLLCHHLHGPEMLLLESGAEWGDPGDLEETRIAAGRPRFGIDVDFDTHINETALLAHAVSFTKGCYPGQESVARVQNLGRVKRQLRVLETAGPVAAGNEVVHNGATVGKITSSARSHALAMIASDVPVGASVNVSDVEAVATDAGWAV